MSYTIIYKHAFNTTSERWHGSLGEAQVEAVNCVVSGAADYVEIRASDAKLVDSYPAVSRSLT